MNITLPLNTGYSDCFIEFDEKDIPKMWDYLWNEDHNWDQHLFNFLDEIIDLDMPEDKHWLLKIYKKLQEVLA